MLCMKLLLVSDVVFINKSERKKCTMLHEFFGQVDVFLMPLGFTSLNEDATHGAIKVLSRLDKSNLI